VAVLGPGRGEHRPPGLLQALPVLWPPIIFCKYNTNICFLRFQIVEKWVNLQLPFNVQIPKVLQLQEGGLDPLTRGFAPGPRWLLCPQTPIIGSRYSARHGAVPPDVSG